MQGGGGQWRGVGIWMDLPWWTFGSRALRQELLRSDVKLMGWTASLGVVQTAPNAGRGSDGAPHELHGSWIGGSSGVLGD